MLIHVVGCLIGAVTVPVASLLVGHPLWVAALLYIPGGGLGIAASALVACFADRVKVAGLHQPEIGRTQLGPAWQAVPIQTKR